MLLTIAFAAIVSASGAKAPGESGRSSGYSMRETAVEPDDEHEAPSPLAPIDVDDDDDDDREAFTQPSTVVPLDGRVKRRAESTGETIQPSLGHQRGIDDPPRY